MTYSNSAQFSAGRFNQFFTSLLNPIHQLLAPAETSCLACGSRISVQVPCYPELCLSCYSSIPWIKQPRCPACGRHVGCPDCSRNDGIQRSSIINRSSVAYNASMREWLAQYKYRGHEAYGTVLARMMGRAVHQMRNAAGIRQASFDVVTFVPLSDERWAERGFNQAEVMARGAALAGGRNGSGLPLLHLLMRTRHTDKQSFKSRNERLQNMRGVFQALPDAPERLATVVARSRGDRLSQVAAIRLLLVDDVYTTGSTINACASVLYHICNQLGVSGEVCSLTWARS